MPHHHRPGPDGSPDRPTGSVANDHDAVDGSGLRRAIGLPHATAMVAGTIIGASIFVQPSEITGEVPSLVGVAAVWIVAGGLTLLGALVTAELASMLPESGGVYAFLREAWGRPAGFL